MDLAHLTTSSSGILMGAVLGRLLPLRAGVSIAYWIADRLANRPNAPDVRALRFNHQILEGGQLSPVELDERVRAVYRNSARGVAEVLHFQHHPQNMLRYLDAGEVMKEYISVVQHLKQKTIFVCPHIGNFDLAGRALGLMGLRALILAEPTPRVDYNYQNRLRRQTGLNIHPISSESLRLAFQTLEEGGAVLTGVDWPVGEARYRPRFFGKPSLLPTSYVRLAIKAQAPVVVVVCHRKQDGKYFIEGSQPFHIQPEKSMPETILRNTERILAEVEQHIRRDPREWLIYRQAWEDQV